MKFKYMEEVEIEDGFFDGYYGIIDDYSNNSSGIEYHVLIVKGDNEYITGKWIEEIKLGKKEK